MKAALPKRQGVLVAVGGVALLAMAAGAYTLRSELGFWQEAALSTPAPVPAPAAPPREAAPERAAPTPAAPSRNGSPEAPPAARPAPEPPRFDVVRVGARGTAVVAGRAAPGAEVVLLADGARELGRARADGRGEWVILPLDPLPPGTRELSLRARLAGVDVAGGDTVVVVVPEPAAATLVARPADPPALPAVGPVAVLLPPPAAPAAPRLLQGPVAAPPVPQTARLGLSAVEYDEIGDMRFSGTAPPGAAVRLYVGERHAGDARADQAGRWTLRPAEPPPVGRNTLRLDQLAAAGGMVAARLELPFQRDRLPEAAFQAQRVIVQPGNNLWRIARQTYGQGVRYAVIYAANRDQIRDPARIYPGQIFAVPAASAEGPRTPSDSSRSR